MEAVTLLPWQAALLPTLLLAMRCPLQAMQLSVPIVMTGRRLLAAHAAPASLVWLQLAEAQSAAVLEQLRSMLVRRVPFSQSMRLQVADRLKRQYLSEMMSTRLGVKRAAAVKSAAKRQGSDGKEYYDIQVGLLGRAEHANAGQLGPSTLCMGPVLVDSDGRH